MAKSTKSTYHADWLNLTDRSGLVLSEPVLLEHFSDGFKQPNNWLTKQIKHAYEKFDLSDYANASLGFTDAILELLKHTFIKSNAIPSELIVYLPEYAQDLRPQRVLHVNERFIPIYISEKNQNLRTNENLEGKWRASPIAKCERLIKETKSTFGIVTNGSTWRLIYLSSEGSINYIEFDFESMMQEGRLLSAFVAILSSDILSKLKELAEESHKKQIEITDKLGFQVRESVIKFIKILDRANKESKSELLYGVPNDTIYQMSVSTIIKLVFVLYAEQKSMLPHGELLYDKAYGLHTLMSLLNEQKASEELAHRSDAYQQIVALFNIIYHGSNHPDMLSPRYGGEIFDPQKFPLLLDERFEPKNEEIYEILWLLTHAEGKIGKETITQSFSYHSLNVEHIGYIYEGLLDYEVTYNENSLEVVESQDRHSAGAHYTPELITATIAEKTLAPLVESKTAQEISQLKVCDIAMGSGAFLVQVIRYLSENLVKKVQLECDKAQSLSLKINNEEFSIKEDYAQQMIRAKRLITRHCIYGVDINPLAVEISKISIWLETLDRSLPFTFLDHALVSGNSLFGLSQGDFFKTKSLLVHSDLHGLNEALKKRKEIKKLDDLDASTERRKKELLEASNALLEKNIENSNYEFSAYIEEIGSQPFHWVLAFPEVFVDGGFDAIVGNPPYVRQELIKEYKRYFGNYFECATGTADLFIYFFERGFKLLKENGRFGFITSNKYFRAKYGEKLREFLLKNTSIDTIIDLNGVKIFASATVDSAIITFSRTKPNPTQALDIFEGTFEKSFRFLQQNLSKESFTFANSAEFEIKQRIEKIGTPLKNWDIKIYRGIQSGNNNVFIIDEDIKNQLIKEDLKSQEIIKPIIQGRDIYKYHYIFDNKYLIYTTPDIDLTSYKAINKYLNGFYEILNEKKEVKEKKLVWYSLYRPALNHILEFKKNKIIFGQFRNNTYALDTSSIMLSSNEYFIVSNSVNLKYLLSILNSNIIKFYNTITMNSLQGNTTISQKNIFENSPIKIINNANQKPFEIMVDFILALKPNKELEYISSFFEKVIDVAVYELYFKDELHKEGFGVLNILENELKNVEINLQNIEQTYKIWSQKEHKIAYNVYYIHVLDVVKTIEGKK